jgi:ubiquitin C-terminal hydrolase
MSSNSTQSTTKEKSTSENNVLQLNANIQSKIESSSLSTTNQNRSSSNSLSPVSPVRKTLNQKMEKTNQTGNYVGRTGLVNLGNTCYMNASLQVLLNATDLREYFLGNFCF